VCRHLAWLGRPRSLSSLIVEPPHGLLRQSYAPRRQAHGRINADGYGVGWYDESVRAEPARLRRGQPLWTDRSFASLAPFIASRCVLAAVRSATTPFPVDESSAAPFTSGPWLFSHNGSLDDFTAAAPRVHELIPPAASAAVEGPSDSALLWAITRHRLESGIPLDEVLVGVLADITAITSGRLNLLLTDGSTVAATTYGDTLVTRHESGGVVAASEELDDEPGWEQISDGSLLVVTSGGLTITPLPTR
jgi:gamma-glutamyl hercynylcysteine S-oxide hydrolase